MAGAPEPLPQALMFALWTGQRQGDFLKLKWSACDGTRLTSRQSVRKTLLRFKAYPELRAVLDATQRTAVTILTTGIGVPWATGLDSLWRKWVKNLGISGVTLHDLRGTFRTEAYRAGASFNEIAEVSDHSEEQADKIIRKHYLAGNAAIERLEARTGMQTSMKPVNHRYSGPG